MERYESLRRNALGRGDFGEFLVTFIDNHDQVGQSFKHRFERMLPKNKSSQVLDFYSARWVLRVFIMGPNKALRARVNMTQTFARRCLIPMTKSPMHWISRIKFIRDFTDSSHQKEKFCFEIWTYAYAENF